MYQFIVLTFILNVSYITNISMEIIKIFSLTTSTIKEISL